jgi:RNA polymerase sigma factor for flagellar operon FliA
MTLQNKSIDELIKNGQALVHSLALRIFSGLPMSVELDDLIAYGQLGLAEAARDFRPDQETQFTTFAYYRVKGSIYDGLSKMSWTTRARFNKMRQESEARYRAEQAAGSSQPTDLSGPVTNYGRVVRLDDTDPDSTPFFVDRAPSPSTQALNREMSTKLMELVKTLPLIERQLIEDVYFEGISLQDSATRHGISKSWASRVHSRTLEELGRALRRMGAGED